MPKRERKSRNKAKRRRVDFSGVQAGGRRRIPSGDYPFKIVEISEDEGDAGTYWTVVSEVMTGKHKGFKDYNNYSFSSKALWKLRQLLEACGIDVPESSMNLNPRDVIGLTSGGSVEDDTYKGKTRSKVMDVFSIDELEESDDDDEDEDDDDEDEEDDDEEIDDDEDDEEEEEEEEEPPKKKKKKKRRK